MTSRAEEINVVDVSTHIPKEMQVCTKKLNTYKISISEMFWESFINLSGTKSPFWN